LVATVILIAITVAASAGVAGIVARLRTPSIAAPPTARLDRLYYISDDSWRIGNRVADDDNLFIRLEGSTGRIYTPQGSLTLTIRYTVENHLGGGQSKPVSMTVTMGPTAGSVAITGAGATVRELARSLDPDANWAVGSLWLLEFTGPPPEGATRWRVNENTSIFCSVTYVGARAPVVPGTSWTPFRVSKTP